LSYVKTLYENTNKDWIYQLNEIMKYGEESAPRGMPIKEIIGNRVSINMNAPIVTLPKRKMNYKFAIAEAHWICSGSNKLSDITEVLPNYADYSSDGYTLSGAYGPKFVDQLGWVVNTLIKDPDSRQAVVSLWRERPGPDPDIACTLSQQYFIRNGQLNVVATMRSNDMFWGFCYDIFTFTMMAKMVQTCLAMRGINVDLGRMTLNQGSAHIYERHWDLANEIIAKDNSEPDDLWNYDVTQKFDDPEEFLSSLAVML